MGEHVKIRFALLGCGRIGKRYIQLLTDHPRTELVALIDSKSNRELGINSNIPFFTRLEDFFASRINADIIVIATPNGLHAEHAVNCLRNKLNVLIEKPIALRTKDVHKIIDEAEASGMMAFAVMQNRYAKAASWLKNLVESGEFGEIYLVQVNCFWNRDERYYNGHEWHGSKLMDGGPLFTQFAHFVDMLYWLFGDIVNVQGRLANFAHQGVTQFEDTGVLNFEFAQGGIGSFNFTTAAWGQNFESSISIIGEKGTVKVGGQYMERVEYCHLRNRTFAAGQLGTEEATTGHHLELITDVVKVLSGENAYKGDASDGLAVVDIIERMNSQLKFSLKKSVV